MLRSRLQSVRHSADVTAVFTALGYRPASSRYDLHAFVRARWRGFVVVAADRAQPVDGARALARHLANQGERGIAVCIGSRRLAIAAPRPGTADTTRVLVIDIDEPTALGLSRLEALAPRQSSSALAHALRVAEALSAEAAGDRFFGGFRALWSRMADALPESVSASDRRHIALLTLTRMLFLYFVQAKGWLDGNRSFLRSLLERTLAEGGQFHRDALQPLLFHTLNRPPDRRAATQPGMPYLNGGLFEPHPVERRLAPACFSNAVWIDAFENLFDRYHFCVQEAHAVDAVAPDMLGHVFERLMEGDERSRTGTYFTPEELVREVVEDALGAVLSRSASILPGSIERLLASGPLDAEECTRLAAALRALRILDPAAGSGAFLLGALDTLTAFSLHVSPPSDTRDRWRMRRRILQENLFGVDRNPTAVRLAELRLWLAVVADDPATDAADVEPLPNLDGVVRQGNTLIDPVGTTRVHLPHLAPAAPHAVRRVAEARAAVFTARGRAATRAIHTLRESELALARATLDQAIAACEHHVRDGEALTQSTDLFGRHIQLSANQRRRARSLAADLTELQRVRNEVQHGALPFFAFEVHAPDVIRAGGFDMIIGNPPWVRAEKLAPQLRRQLRDRFSLWVAGEGDGYRHLPDLAVAFLERALELVRAGGVVALLIPGKLASAGYGAAVRQHLAARTTIVRVHRIPDRRARGFRATTYPLEVVVRNEAPPPQHRVHIGSSRRATVTQARLTGPGPWILVPDHARDAVDAFCAAGPALRSIAQPRLGVKTGADRLLVGRLTAENQETVQVRFPTTVTTTIEAALVRPAMRGRDIRPFRASTRHVILWGYDVDGSPLPSLPPLTDAYVREYASVLADRSDYRSGPPWTLFRTAPAFLDHRVAWSDISATLTALAIDEINTRIVPLNTCYVAAFPDRTSALAAAAVLNSTWASAYVRVAADEARGGYRRCNARVIGRIPFPPPSRIQALADLSHQAHHHLDVRIDQIDAAVATALELTEHTQTTLRSLAAHR
jgi:hypothetical protein